MPREHLFKNAVITTEIEIAAEIDPNVMYA